MSCRETWEKVKVANGTTLNSVVPECHDPRLTDRASATTVKRKYSCEADMYTPVTAFVAKHLTSPRKPNHPGIMVVDTHARYYLDGQAPDITLTVQDLANVDSASVVAIIELKPPTVTPMASECFGQVYDYLRKLSSAQPNRRKIVGMLSNLRQNHIIIHESRNQDTVRIVHYASVSFAKALRFLKEMILKDASTLPSIPSFSFDLGLLESRLGNPVFSVIGVFTYSPKLVSHLRWVTPDPVRPGVKIVVKRTSFAPPPHPRQSVAQSLTSARAPATPTRRPVAHEITILQAIRGAANVCPHLPKLIYFSLDMDEFGITPRGMPVNLHTIGQPRARKLLDDILVALEWLHNEKIIHRDVRWDNIVTDAAGNGILIDFGAAVIDNGCLQEYAGGIVCAPSRVIGDFDRHYKPSAADDCVAWVLLLNALLSPMRWAGMRSDEITKKGSMEQKRMQTLWQTLESSREWGPGLKAAKNKQYSVMKGMLDLVVLL